MFLNLYVVTIFAIIECYIRDYIKKVNNLLPSSRTIVAMSYLYLIIIFYFQYYQNIRHCRLILSEIY